MRHSLTLGLISALLALPAFAAPAATVNGVAISQTRLNAAIQQMTQTGQTDSPQLRNAALDRLVLTEILSQQAIKAGLNSTPAYQVQMDNISSALLAQQLIGNYLKTHPLSDAALKAEYKSLTSSLNQKQYHIRQINVASEAAAQQVFAQLKRGAMFSVVAQQHSTDTLSKTHGGDLGWLDPKTLDPALAAVVLQMTPGQIYPLPIQTGNTWHILQLVNTQDTPFPPFDQVKAKIVEKLQGQQLDAYITGLKQQASVQ